MCARVLVSEMFLVLAYGTFFEEAVSREYLSELIIRAYTLLYK